MAREAIVSFTNTVEANDLRGFFFFTLFIKPRWTIPSLLFAFGVGAAVLPLGGLYTWLAALLLAGEFIFLYMRARAWRRFREASAGEIGRRYQIMIDNYALRLTDEAGHTAAEHRWGKVVEIWERKRHFFVYLGPFSACILPKRQLSPEEARRLSLFFRQKAAGKYHYFI